VASYIHKCPDDVKQWMNQFMGEYNEANTKNAVFHTTAETRKICNDKNNARNRCQYTEAVAANRLNLVENDYEMEKLLHSTEDELEADDFKEWHEEELE